MRGSGMADRWRRLDGLVLAMGLAEADVTCIAAGEKMLQPPRCLACQDQPGLARPLYGQRR